ncbi:MAG: hypothetical protein JSU61_02680, partial [Fidelibacterota bacterium]
HQLGMAEELCDRVGILRHGRLVANQPVDELLRLSSEDLYLIKYTGQTSEWIRTQFPQLLAGSENGLQTLKGVIEDQASLYQLLEYLKGNGMELHSVVKQAPDLEEVFIRLTEGGCADG